MTEQTPIYTRLVAERGGDDPLESPGLFSWAWGGNETFEAFEARARANAEPHRALDAPAPTARQVAKKKK